MKVLRIGIVGCGKIAEVTRRTAVPGSAALVRCATVSSAAEQLAVRYGIPAGMGLCGDAREGAAGCGAHHHSAGVHLALTRQAVAAVATCSWRSRWR